MLKSGDSILADIDSTLDQLIRNADAMHQISDRRLFTSEVKAMHKTQESLLSRLMHMHETYEKEKTVVGERAQKMRLTSIEHKLAAFGRLNARLIRFLENGMQMKAKEKVKVRPSRRKARV